MYTYFYSNIQNTMKYTIYIKPNINLTLKHGKNSGPSTFCDLGVFR